MKIKKFSFLAVLLAAGLTSCSNSEEGFDGTTQETGETTNFNVIIQQPKTYADDESATASEIEVKSIDVIIFDHNSTFVDRHHVDNPTPDPSDPTKYVLTGLSTTTGEKEIFVGLNLNPALLQGYSKGVSKAASLDKALTATVSDLTSNGIAMFSEEGVKSVLVKPSDVDYNNRNVIRTNVARMVAKVTVQKASGLELRSDKEVEKGVVGGHILPDMSFAIRNINKLVYPIQRKNEGTSVVIDPNWADGSFNSSDFYHETTSNPDQYIAIDESTTAIKQLNVKYANENTSEKHYQQETTYASVRATFIPDEFTNLDGTPTDNSAATTGVDFWTLTLDQQGGAVLYFNDYNVMKDYAENNLPDGTYTASERYRNGYCYYNMFLNPSNDEGNEYGTLRNEYYKTNITRIYGLGNPNPGDGGEEEIPVVSVTHIDVEVTMLPWSVVSDDYELNK